MMHEAEIWCELINIGDTNPTERRSIHIKLSGPIRPGDCALRTPFSICHRFLLNNQRATNATGRTGKFVTFILLLFCLHRRFIFDNRLTGEA